MFIYQRVSSPIQSKILWRPPIWPLPPLTRLPWLFQALFEGIPAENPHDIGPQMAPGIHPKLLQFLHVSSMKIMLKTKQFRRHLHLGGYKIAPRWGGGRFSWSKLWAKNVRCWSIFTNGHWWHWLYGLFHRNCVLIVLLSIEYPIPNIFIYIYRFHMIPWFFWMVHFSPHIQPINVHMDSYRTSAHFIPGAGHPNHLLTVGLKEAVASSFWGNSRAFPTSHSVKLSLSTSLPFQHLLGCVTCKPRRLSVLYFRHLLKGKSCALGRTGMSKIWKWWISNVYIHNSIMHWSYSNGCSGPQMVNANGKQNRSSLNVESHTWYTCRSSCNMHRKSSILYHMILCIDNTVHIRSI